MAIPSTNTATLLFSSQQPAWEAGVELTQAMTTRLFTSRAGLEQRQQARMRSAWKMKYTIHLDRAALPTRDARNRAEIATAVVVPLWPERATIAAMTADLVTISRTATDDFFSIGDYIYLHDPTTNVGQFRVVTGYGVSLQALELETLSGTVVFDPGANAYPCRICSRQGGTAEQTDENDFAIEEEVSYATL